MECSQTRDAWLDKIKSKVPSANIDRLRFGSLNTKELFDSDELGAAIKAAQDQRTNQAQNTLMNKVSEIAVNTSTNKTQQKRTFEKQSFQEKKPPQPQYNQYRDRQQNNRQYSQESERGQGGGGQYSRDQGRDQRPGRDQRQGGSGRKFQKKNLP